MPQTPPEPLHTPDHILEAGTAAVLGRTTYSRAVAERVTAPVLDSVNELYAAHLVDKSSNTHGEIIAMMRELATPLFTLDEMLSVVAAVFVTLADRLDPDPERVHSAVCPDCSVIKP